MDLSSAKTHTCKTCTKTGHLKLFCMIRKVKAVTMENNTQEILRAANPRHMTLSQETGKRRKTWSSY
jgi:hypothetical protein